MTDEVYSRGDGLDLGVRVGGFTYNSSSYNAHVELLNYQGEICQGHGIPDLPETGITNNGIVTFEGKRIYVLAGSSKINFLVSYHYIFYKLFHFQVLMLIRRSLVLTSVKDLFPHNGLKKP